MAKLLVVEQDDRQRAAYRETLERAAFEVIEAATASEAVLKCECARPDLVLLDPHLGRYLGKTKGKWVADQTHLCGSAPIVVVADGENPAELEAFSPDAIVSRDVGAEELVETVSGLLRA